MSKVLIDSEDLQALLTCTDMNVRTYLAMRIAKMASEQSRCSILEWHPSSEKPTIGKAILIRHPINSTPTYKTDVVMWENTLFCKDGDEWAYLPE